MNQSGGYSKYEDVNHSSNNFYPAAKLSARSYQRYRLPKSNAKIVNDSEMQSLQIEAAANLFFSKISASTESA